MTTIIILALAMVAAFLITLSRVIGWKRIVQHATVIDVIFTIVAAIMLAGTLTGIAAAIVAGLVLALTLSVAKWCMTQPKRYTRALKQGYATYKAA